MLRISRQKKATLTIGLMVTCLTPPLHSPCLTEQEGRRPELSLQLEKRKPQGPLKWIDVCRVFTSLIFLLKNVFFKCLPIKSQLKNI